MPRTTPNRPSDKVVSLEAYSSPSPSQPASASTSNVSETETAAPEGQLNAGSSTQTGVGWRIETRMSKLPSTATVSSSSEPSRIVVVGDCRIAGPETVAPATKLSASNTSTGTMP